jgi:uroporphyrinogen decarboxylase
VPVIVFSKGTRDWKSLAETGANVVGIDHEIPMVEAAKQLPGTIGLQGNFDPELLRDATSDTIISSATVLLNQMRGRNGHIFNLGHGVPPDAKLENLQALVNTVQNFI